MLLEPIQTAADGLRAEPRCSTTSAISATWRPGGRSIRSTAGCAATVEWSRSTETWEILASDGAIVDPTLVIPLPLQPLAERDAVLRLLTRVGIALEDDDRARILGCSDGAILDAWLDRIVGAKTAAEVLSPRPARPRKRG